MMKLKVAISVVIALAMFAFLATIIPSYAQTQRARAVVTAGTIAVTDTFQTAKGADDQRSNCTIQNTGTNPMYVYLGTSANATKALSFQVLTKLYFSTNIGGVTAMDAIQVTGTATDTWVLACY